jgi:hypothetical protein
MTATSPTGFSMRDLLASCAAADTISRPPRAPECPEGATKGTRGCAESAATAARAREATTSPHPPDNLTPPPAERPAA